MLVQVKLYATLRKFAPNDVELGKAFQVEIDVATVSGILDKLGIGKEQAKIIMINGMRITNLNHSLSPEDTIVIFPPVGGG
jgi:molybdopterin synthase sulfur carrier subunit